VSEPSPSSMLVIGVGNEFRGDDAAGLAVLRLLKAKNVARVTFMEADSGCELLLERWATAEKVMIIDAVASGAKPGTVYRFDARAQPIPASCSFYSTHAFGIVENVELARVFDQLPPSLTVYGIEGENFTTGADLSPVVKQAVDEVVAQVMLDMQEWSEP
jgi:hydrogenase maturation protease